MPGLEVNKEEEEVMNRFRPPARLSSLEVSNPFPRLPPTGQISRANGASLYTIHLLESAQANIAAVKVSLPK